MSIGPIGNSNHIGQFENMSYLLIQQELTKFQEIFTFDLYSQFNSSLFMD